MPFYRDPPPPPATAVERRLIALASNIVTITEEAGEEGINIFQAYAMMSNVLRYDQFDMIVERLIDLLILCRAGDTLYRAIYYGGPIRSGYGGRPIYRHRCRCD